MTFALGGKPAASSQSVGAGRSDGRTDRRWCRLANLTNYLRGWAVSTFKLLSPKDVPRKSFVSFSATDFFFARIVTVKRAPVLTMNTEEKWYGNKIRDNKYFFLLLQPKTLLQQPNVLLI